MTYFDPVSVTDSAIHSDDVLRRRQRAARIAVIGHLAGVLVLGGIMITTEGPAAPANLSDGTTLAEVQIFLLAATWLAQLALLGNWARHALLRHRIRAAGPQAAQPDQRDRWDKTMRTERITVQVCMTAVVAVSWLAEIGYLAAATYQLNSRGSGDPDTGFTIGMVVIFAMIAIPAALTLLMLRLTGHAQRAAKEAFAPLASPLTSDEDPAVTLVKLGRARILAVRYLAFSSALILGIAALFAWAAAAGQLDARIGFMAPALLLINLTWTRRWTRAVGKIRQAEALLLRQEFVRI